MLTRLQKRRWETEEKSQLNNVEENISENVASPSNSGLSRAENDRKKRRQDEPENEMTGNSPNIQVPNPPLRESPPLPPADRETEETRGAGEVVNQAFSPEMETKMESSYDVQISEHTANIDDIPSLDMRQIECLQRPKSCYLDINQVNLDSLRTRVSPLLQPKIDLIVSTLVTRAEQLDATLCFLAKGYSLEFLTHFYKISRPLLKQTIVETCSAILQALHDYCRPPSSPRDWLEVASGFNRKYDICNCIGALDGMRIMIKDPEDMFCEHEGKACVCLLVVVDSRYRFLKHDTIVSRQLDDQGQFDDDFVFAASSIVTAMTGIPRPRTVGGFSKRLPFVLVGSEVCPPQSCLLKAYTHPGLPQAEANFNTRVYNVTSMSAKALRVLVNKFAVLNTAIDLQPDEAAVW